MGPFTDEDYKDIEAAHDVVKRVVERSCCPRNRSVMGLGKVVLILGGLVLQGRVEKAMRDAPR